MRYLNSLHVFIDYIQYIFIALFRESSDASNVRGTMIGSWIARNESAAWHRLHENAAAAVMDLDIEIMIKSCKHQFWLWICVYGCGWTEWTEGTVDTVPCLCHVPPFNCLL